MTKVCSFVWGSAYRGDMGKPLSFISSQMTLSYTASKL